MSMNLADLQQILEAAEKSSWNSVHIKFGETEIRLGDTAHTTASVGVLPAAQAAVPVAVPSAISSGGHEPSAEPHRAEVLTAPSKDAPGELVTSPMLGTYWAAPDPSKPPFVSVGERVTKGQKLCIIEVMKLMTDVTAPFDGTVSAIYPSNGGLLEYGDPIFRIDAS